MPLHQERPHLQFQANPFQFCRPSDVCHLKAVRLAYHTACQPCTEARGKCAKCGKEPVHHPYQVVGVASKEDEERVLLLKMTERQRRTYFRELEREQGGGRKKKQANDSDPELSDDDDGEDDLGDMPAPPTNKFDPDMLVKERAARAGVQEEGKTKKSDENDDEDSNSDNLDGSAESYEEDSDELDRLDAEAEKLVGKRDPLTQNDDGEDAGSEDEAGSESEDEE